MFFFFLAAQVSAVGWVLSKQGYYSCKAQDTTVQEEVGSIELEDRVQR